MIEIALAVYIVGVIGFGLFVAVPIVGSADCDQAFLIMLPIAVLMVALWPLVPLWALAAYLMEKVTGR